MAFIGSRLDNIPVDANGRPYELHRRIKLFEGNDIATVETAVNNFLIALRTLQANVFLDSIAYTGLTGGASSRCLVSYGYFLPAP